MSVHHHDSDFYDFLTKTRRRCIRPDCVNRTQQFHHMSLMNSDKSGQLLPRRYSTYQVVWVCAPDHDEAGANERAWIGLFPKGLDTIYDEVFLALGAYRSTLVNRLHKAKVLVPHFQHEGVEGLQGVQLQREVLRQLHHHLNGLTRLCEEREV